MASGDSHTFRPSRPAEPQIGMLRHLIVRDTIALGTLTIVTIAIFSLTWLYFNAYAHYRTAHGLNADRTPDVTLPTVHLPRMRHP